MSPAGDPEEASEAELEALAERIREGKDGIAVPGAMLDEPAAAPEEPSMSLYARVRAMNVPERIKLAMKGNHEVRSILLRDSNRLIRRMVLVNPKITEEEIVTVCKDRNADADLLRGIGDNRDWLENYSVRCSLTENPRTPITISLRLLKTLNARDVRTIAKSRNVSASLSGTARRLLFEKEQVNTPRH